MRELLILALIAVCVIGPSAAVLAEEAARAEMDKTKADPAQNMKPAVPDLPAPYAPGAR